MKYKKIVAIILMTVLYVTGCGFQEENKFYQAGDFGYTLTPTEIMVGVKSQTNIFEIDNVSIDLYYGLFDSGYMEKYNQDMRNGYTKSVLSDKPILFSLYICAGDYELSILNDQTYEEYSEIENHYYLRSLSEKEAFSDEYGYTIDRKNGVTYNHCEKIVIPSQFFNKDKGEVVVKIVAFQGPLEAGKEYYTTIVGFVTLDYELTDDGQVKITSLSKD